MGIPFTHVAPALGSDRWWNNLMIRCRSYGNGLLGRGDARASAGLGTPAIEAEGEFVEVVVEMLVLDAALMGSHQPSLQQRRNIMNAGHDHVSRIETAADYGDLMLVAQRRQASITAPAVSVDGRSGHGDSLNEGDQTVRRSVRDAAQADAADATTTFPCRHNDNGLVLGLTSALSLFRAADVSLVDLDLAGEAIAARADHRPAQLMQPGPGRLLAAQAEHALKAQRADAVLLAGDEPHGEKPHPQRLARVLQHRSSRQRYLPIARATAQ